MATRLIIDGQVQGVGYREWLRREATTRGIKGWVRNLSDGRVEAVVIASYAATDALIAACRHGPPAAKVDSIGLDPVDDPDVDEFLVLPTI